MAQNNLATTTANGGEQTTTGSPQNATAVGSFTGQQASAVQPGTASNLLANQPGQSGLPLRGTQLTTVNLKTSTAATATPSATPARHLNPALFVVSGILLVVAVVLFWTAARSAKTTTN